ncbi:putative eka-like protein [Erysiphe necator]|uniref:Putative eka-like protein n=1 Tax=Uncinula necator TaxID=52586 RepID=A0A0B1P7G4_UNCNE|nr:putative eka-like protein [Erysiphe necator]
MRNDKNSKKSNSDKSDSRLFVRLPLEHKWRKLSPACIREMIVKRLSISPASIGLIKPVRTGFALSPCSIEARENILNASGGLFLSGAKLEPATQWTPLLIPTVLKTINTLQGRKEISELMLADEIERVSSVRPEAVKLYGYQKPDAPHRTWLALFTKTPKPRFRVFDESGISSIFKKQTPIEFCKRCNVHYPSKFCSRAPSCGNCGSTMHTQGVCMAATRC